MPVGMNMGASHICKNTFSLFPYSLIPYWEHVTFAEKVSQCGLGVSPSRATGEPLRSWGLPK